MKATQIDTTCPKCGVRNFTLQASSCVQMWYGIGSSMDLHLIADNYATHKHPQVKAWLARHPRFHLHFTPTYSSWLNQVRTLVRTDNPTGDSARLVSQRPPTGRQNRAVCPALQ